MSCPDYERLEERLHDYAGGYLSGRARQEVDEHLLICAGCRDEVRALESLLEDLSTLPASIEPPAEVWQATSRGIRSRETGRPAPAWLPARLRGRGSTSPLGTWTPLAVAAAAVLVAAASLYVAFQATSRQQGAPAPAGPAVARDAGAPAAGITAAGAPDIDATEADFQRAAEELLAALEARRGELPPNTLSVIENNLTAINNAIRRTRQAMESDPGNPALGGLMRAMYRRKMNLLQGASEIPAI